MGASPDPTGHVVGEASEALRRRKVESTDRPTISSTSLLSVDPDLLVIEPNDIDAQLEAAQSSLRNIQQHKTPCSQSFEIFGTERRARQTL